MSAILQTIIGAAAAIVGGFVGAWWQTRRADDIARRIRREERRETGLVALAGKAGDVLDHLRVLSGVAEAAPDTGQYEAARQAIEELRQLWLTELSTVIPDRAVTEAVVSFAVKANEFLSWGAKATEGKPVAKVKHFSDHVRELYVLLTTVRAEALRATGASRSGR
jgi:hypothetical protein